MLTRIPTAWTATHAFFAIMGGFHYYQNGQPLSPLHPDEVLELVRLGALVPPTLNELRDKSKGDALSKGLAIIQTLWFVTQCIARRIEHLPVTSLEIMTLAYTVITVAMYTAWWHKPLNISCPVRVAGTPEAGETQDQSFWDRIFDYVMGNQDWLVALSEEDRVPKFWSGGAENDNSVLAADIIALFVAMIFGAVHCIAWSYEFPSPIERLLWRISAIIIVAVPVCMILLTFMIRDLFGYRSYTPMQRVGEVFLAICAIFYIASRLILLVLSFTTLRSLHLGAYQTIQWTTLIPHL